MWFTKLTRDCFLQPFHPIDDLGMRNSSDSGSPRSFLHTSDLNMKKLLRLSKCVTSSWELCSGWRRCSIMDSRVAYEWMMESPAESTKVDSNGIPNGWKLRSCGSFFRPQGSIGTKLSCSGALDVHPLEGGSVGLGPRGVVSPHAINELQTRQQFHDQHLLLG